PVTLANIAEAQRKLGAAARDVQLVFVTVDPKRDNPDRLREYLTAFSPAFVGATGEPSELVKVRDAYGIIAKEVVYPNGSAGYDHSSYVYLLDRRGRIRVLVPFGTKPGDIVDDIKMLLAEPS